MNDVTNEVNAELIQKKIKINWQSYDRNDPDNLSSQPMTPEEASDLLNKINQQFGDNVRNVFSIVSSPNNPATCCIVANLTHVDRFAINKNASMAYTMGATAAVLKEHLPPELGTKVGLFVDRTSGQNAGRTHREAHQTGKGEVQRNQEKVNNNLAPKK